MACSGDDPANDTDGDADADMDADADADADTDNPLMWIDRRIETSATLYGVYTGGTGAWVVGTDATVWRIESGAATPLSTDLDDSIDLQGIWGTGDGTTTELWAVGTSGTILQYLNGEFESWDIGTATFQDVDGPSDTQLTAVGWGGVYNQSGADWNYQNAGGSYRLASVRIGTSTDIAVGDAGVILTRPKGGEWSIVSVTGTSGSAITRDLHAVHGETDDDVWVVGEDATILHWDGSAWTQIGEDLIPTTGTLWGVYSTSGEVFAVGNNGVALVGNETDGFATLNTGVDANLYAVYGSSAENVWAVGNRGQVLRYTGEPVE
jgi:hypothetical protein